MAPSIAPWQKPMPTVRRPKRPCRCLSPFRRPKHSCRLPIMSLREPIEGSVNRSELILRIILMKKTILFAALLLAAPLLLHAQEAAIPAPDSQSRSFGPLRYPVSGGSAAKLLPDVSVVGSFAG